MCHISFNFCQVSLWVSPRLSFLFYLPAQTVFAVEGRVGKLLQMFAVVSSGISALQGQAVFHSMANCSQGQSPACPYSPISTLQFRPYLLRKHNWSDFSYVLLTSLWQFHEQYRHLIKPETFKFFVCDQGWHYNLFEVGQGLVDQWIGVVFLKLWIVTVADQTSKVVQVLP